MKRKNIKLTVSHNLPITEALTEIVKAIGGKKAFKYLGVSCLSHLALYSSIFPTNAKAKLDGETRETAEMMAYMIEHWDELLPKAQEEWKAKNLQA